MTLILGLECKEGLVLVSDGQATLTPTGQPAQAVRMPVEKIFPWWQNVAWGAAGHSAIAQGIGIRLAKNFKPESFDNEVRGKIKEDLAGKVREYIEASMKQSAAFYGTNIQPLFTSHIFVGRAKDGPFIFVVQPDLTCMDYTYAGYAAIGSGEIFPHFALAGLKHFAVRQRSLREAKLIAYRVIEDAIGVSAFGLGPPIQVIEIPNIETKGQPGRAKKLNDDEVKVLGDDVVAWKEVEREDLGRFVGVAPIAPEPPLAAPGPPKAGSAPAAGPAANDKKTQ